MRMLVGSCFAALLALGGLLAATVQAGIGARHAAIAANAEVGLSEPAPSTILASRSGAPVVYGWVRNDR